MKNTVKCCIAKLINFLRHYKCYRFYSSKFKRYLKLNGFENKKTKGEESYVKQWRALSKRVEPYSYRFFRHFCGATPNIIPEDIGHSYIEAVLNPVVHRHTYGDKNFFPIIIGKECLPKTIICRINNGNLLDGNFKIVKDDLSSYLKEYNSLILKQSVNTSSGKSIIKFLKKGGKFLSVDNNIELTKQYLLSFSDNFCLQTAIDQHPFMNRLCSSSINTIRLCLYRSIKNEDIHVTASVLRIGKDGSIVDNIHSGGMFIGVEPSTGAMGKCVLDQYGHKRNTWNGIDYANNSFNIPFWNDILSFAKYVGSKILHHRLIALDIALGHEGNPILVEYNINTFSYWLFMLTNQEVFGSFTEEVIYYCKEHYQDEKK